MWGRVENMNIKTSEDELKPDEIEEFKRLRKAKGDGSLDGEARSVELNGKLDGLLARWLATGHDVSELEILESRRSVYGNEIEGRRR